MQNQAVSSVSHEVACERVASRFAKSWLRYYAASKLRSDPIFAAAYELFRASSEPILDVGCGIGLLPFYLRERGCEQAITGLDTDRRKIDQAYKAAAGRYHRLQLLPQDVRDGLPEFGGNVAVFDLLHYLEPARQTALLVALAARVSPGGMLLLRDGVRDGSARYWMTYAGELFAQATSWTIGVPLHFPTSESIDAAFSEKEFTRENRPAWGGTPFNNQLFIFRRTL
jgi:2-polyprenyl-3-methyl-5-hydroxy-6-metoxy-1,4-benzoquinol methylase